MLEQCSLKDLSPIEFVRLREVIKQRRSDEALIGLSDEEILKALRFAETRDGKLVPKVAAVLLFGFEEALRRFLPAHQVFFQALDERMNVKVNEALSLPLLHLLQELERRFVARNQEQELLSGLFRVPIPNFSPEGFREALNNAVLHRNYSRQDPIYVQWFPDRVEITNPGGFPPGITLSNLLVHEPKPRNPLLAEASA